MSTQRAVLTVDDPKPGALTRITNSFPIIEPNENQILIKTVAVAVNPTDWKHIINKDGHPGDLNGNDASGVVFKVGQKVKGFKEGDIVSTFVHGGFYKTRGAFAEYVIADPQVTIKFDPETFQKHKVLAARENYESSLIDTFEGAASIPLSICTVVLSFAGNLNISSEDRGKYILIWGGATSTGTLGIQMAKCAYGLKVITVSSPKNFEYLKGLGADHVLDYRATNVADDINAISKGDIVYALDTVATKETFQLMYDSTYNSDNVKLDSLLFLGATDITIDDRKGMAEFVEPTMAHILDGIVPLEIYGDVYNIEPEVRSRYDDFWFNELPKILPNIKHPNLKVLPQGFESVNPGLSLLQEGKVSGEKVVFRI